MELDEAGPLGPDQLKYLADEHKERYRRLESLFAADGWPLLVALCKKQAVEAHNRAANSQTWEQNRMNVGLRTAYEHIAVIEKATYAEFTEIAETARQAELEAELEDELKHQS